MKLIRIGSSNNCNIVLQSKFVSALHAELLLKDDGQLVLQDKNSLNGTFLGSKRISPNQDYVVHRGDLIRFGDTELNWSAVPSSYGPKKNEEWVNIGTSELCEEKIDSQFASRYHAILITRDKDKYFKKKVFLMDNGSVNGTLVNGQKITKNKAVPIKRGDNIICGDVDVTEQLKPRIPNRLVVLKYALISLAAVAAIVGIIIGIGPDGINLPWKNWIKTYKPAVVYVDAAYHYEAVFNDIPISKDIWDGVFTYPISAPYSATAFFIDQYGVMATNRHVVNPGEYEDDAVKTQLRITISDYLKDGLDKKCSTMEDIESLSGTYLGNIILQQWMSSMNGNVSLSARSLKVLNSIIQEMKNAKFDLIGKLDYITVGYSGRYYTNLDEYDRCFVLDESGSAEQDVALLQLNTKHTPDNLKKNIIDINKKVFMGKNEPMKHKLAWIGFPRGIGWNLDHNTHTLEPEIRSSSISKAPSLYSFETQGEVPGGASGSPLFDTKSGKLFGVVFGSWAGGATYSHACKASCLKDLYEKNRPVIELR
jgi:pSer/pThr/pTyr-binding forkhead associated (FHA) protein